MLSHEHAKGELTPPRTLALSDRYFPYSHPLYELSRPRLEKVRELFAQVDILHLNSFGSWRPTNIKSTFPNHNSGSEKAEALGGTFLSAPGKNTIYLPNDTSVDAIEYQQRQGLLGDVCCVANLEELVTRVRTNGRKLYTCNALPESLDSISVNSAHDMQFINSKLNLSKLTQHTPPEIRKHVDELTLRDFYHLQENGSSVFLKLGNGEGGGKGVFKTNTIEEFQKALAQIKDRCVSFNLNPIIVAQRGIQGKSCSFQVLLDPQRPNEIQVLALSDQIIAQDGASYVANYTYSPNIGRIYPVGSAILNFVHGVRTHCPNAWGVLTCDYIRSDNGEISLIDAALRPTANTGAAIAKLILAERGFENAFVTNNIRFRVPITQTLSQSLKHFEKYIGINSIIERRSGLLLQGYNPQTGDIRFIGVAETLEALQTFAANIRTIR